MAIQVKSERLSGGGVLVSAQASDWDVMQMIPGAILRDIVDAITKRFLEENGDLIMEALKPEVVSEAIAKEMRLRVSLFIASKTPQKK